MEQYNHEQQVGAEPKPIAPKKIVDPEVHNLRARVREQERQIQDLQAQIKQLKNEVRVVVNAFNLKNG